MDVMARLGMVNMEKILHLDIDSSSPFGEHLSYKIPNTYLRNNNL